MGMRDQKKKTRLQFFAAYQVEIQAAL